jgi:hypothetical protein
MAYQPYSRGSDGPTAWDWKDIQIAKQAVLKSLLEAKKIDERTPEAEKLCDRWVSWIFRKSQIERNMLEGKDETNVQDFVKSLN